MPGRRRIPYPGAIYHVMARGNSRQDIVDNDANREGLMNRPERTVRRSGWVLHASALMTNHLHLFVFG